MQTKASLRDAFEADPTLLDKLRHYEAEMAKSNKHGVGNYFMPDKVPPAFRTKVKSKATGKEWDVVTIDDVWRWATDPDQPTLEFGDPPTCMSQYGLCE